MFIKNDEVTDWRDLQNKVALLFRELGCKVTTPRVVELSGRGNKEIDVYVEDSRTSIPQVTIIECKLWGQPIHQEVVHAFYAVMQGCGANAGLIISKAGFQSGAFEATKSTNINLFTFEELQHRFGHEWTAAQRSKVATLLEPLRQAGNLHFDQFSLLPISNNMFFHTNKLKEQLVTLHAWWSCLLGEGNSIWPESYLGPEPVKMARHPLRPFSDPPNGQMWHEAKTVREFFCLLTAGLKAWDIAFQRLRTKAKASFEALSSEDQDRLMNESLQQIREETPIRVLRSKVSNLEFERLLSLIASS